MMGKRRWVSICLMYSGREGVEGELFTLDVRIVAATKSVWEASMDGGRYAVVCGNARHW